MIQEFLPNIQSLLWKAFTTKMKIVLMTPVDFWNAIKLFSNKNKSFPIWLENLLGFGSKLQGWALLDSRRNTLIVLSKGTKLSNITMSKMFSQCHLWGHIALSMRQKLQKWPNLRSKWNDLKISWIFLFYNKYSITIFLSIFFSNLIIDLLKKKSIFFV